jgi:hypothetical protein
LIQVPIVKVSKQITKRKAILANPEGACDLPR